MKQLLCGHTSHRNEAIVEHTFYVSDEHRTYTWNGQSPLDVRIDAVIDVASAYIHQMSHQKPKFQKLELSSQVLRNGEKYYYFLVMFEPPWWDDPDAEISGMTEAIVTLDYKVIEPEIHHFTTEAEYQRHRVLQRLQHQLGSLEPALEQQVSRLSTNILWSLDTALWDFNSEADLTNWLETHTSQSRKRKK
ncbi:MULTISPECIES: DUF4351 domain-containing protein [Trichocoleus]|uniref:DUF4351 domain-containing protein n=1 Tax=Trichocoleus desertorum GB2-A4 TaxID=2933944 RepID=A0ABV0J3T0_9CYAN|nr:DUF4351 domain-containing protein [Trichocoleus sp. FACHB-46]MBD1861790.1 DUF4351 domain-containing protein [Trichocoleus sp. FACHB-46]